MELLDSFGFEPTLFVAQIINFLILAFVFKKFLYKPVLTLLQNRRDTIAQGLKDAEKAQAELQDASNQKDEILKAATLEAEKIILETRKSAENLRGELTLKSKEEADKIITQAKETAANELEKAQNEAKDISIELSRKVLNRVLSDFFTKEEKEKIMKRNIKFLNRI